MVEHLNPAGLINNPAFTQVVAVEPTARIVYVGGQNGVTSDGQVAGTTLGDQTRRALANVATAVAAAGGTLHDVVKWTVYVVDGQPLREGLAAFADAWGRASAPPAITVVGVSSLANPAFLVEIDAIAALADEVRAVEG